MFKNCTSLVTAPTLSATKLATYCYGEMFRGCTSLIDTTELPSLIAPNYCYAGMYIFNNPTINIACYDIRYIVLYFNVLWMYCIKFST